MAYNCKIELNGNLGDNAKVIQKDDKTFVALRVATTDSYPKKDGENTIWVNSNTTLWHDVLVFNPNAVEIAKDFKKGERVEIIGSLSYRPFKDENGYTKQQTSVIGNFVKKVEFGKSDEPSEEDLAAVS